MTAKEHKQRADRRPEHWDDVGDGLLASRIDGHIAHKAAVLAEAERRGLTVVLEPDVAPLSFDLTDN